MKFQITEEFTRFAKKLPKKDRAKLYATIKKIEELGVIVAIKNQWVKKIDDDLYEIRSKFGSSIQRAFYFQLIGDTYVITSGFTKKTQKTPLNEINKAKNIRKRYK